MDYPLEAVPEECRGMPMLTRAELKALEPSIFEQYGMFRAMDSLTCRCLDGRGKNERIPVGVDPNVPHSYWCLMPKNAHEIMINERVFETRESSWAFVFRRRRVGSCGHPNLNLCLVRAHQE
jgi:hypothetical protein